MRARARSRRTEQCNNIGRANVDVRCGTRTQARWSRSVRSKLHRGSRTRQSAAALPRRRRRVDVGRARRGTGCTRARTRTRPATGYRRARPIRTRAQLAESSPPRQSPPISRLICAAGYVTAAAHHLPRPRTAVRGVPFPPSVYRPHDRCGDDAFGTGQWGGRKAQHRGGPELGVPCGRSF